MAKDVKCSVDSCKYYCDGCCEANCITRDLVFVTALKQREMQKLLVIHLNVVENKFSNVVLKIRYCYASHNDTFFHYEHDDFI